MTAVAKALPAPDGSATACDGLAFLEQEDLAGLPGVTDVPLLADIQGTLRAAMDAMGELHLTDGATALAHRRVEAAQTTLDALSAGAPPPSA
ncbi:hypothetical protein PU560_00385, partial [Georgenia sp. 10Sc9-8]|nr:hypothetical protein [Georgenia halotolerans]